MKTLLHGLGQALVVLTLGAAGWAWAVVDGITGPTFNLTAKADHISMGDGGSLLAWGYAADDRGPFPGTMQYPGPTLIVQQGDTVTVNLRNTLPMPVSMVFPGQTGVTASGGSAGLLTREAPADNGASVVTYSFTAGQPGTYLYYSGTRPDLQVEMGLVGAIIVRPAGFDAIANRTAYGHPGSAYDREHLFLLTEVDPVVHDLVAAGQWEAVDSSTFFPVYWFINGRSAPDTLANAAVPWLPTQPYNALPRMHPGEKLLMRVVGAGRDLHPFHHHGNNARMIARDGRLLESAAGAGPDLGVSDFTIKVVPGGTYDALFEWTGKGLGWDIYGHAPGDPLRPNEYAADHGKPFPVMLPNQQDLTFGGHWSGSPFLGQFAALPPGQGGLNPNAGYFFMWHSHTEKEIVNNDIFPGGMMTMLIVEPPGVPIP